MLEPCWATQKQHWPAVYSLTWQLYASVCGHPLWVCTCVHAGAFVCMCIRRTPDGPCFTARSHTDGTQIHTHYVWWMQMWSEWLTHTQTHTHTSLSWALICCSTIYPRLHLWCAKLHRRNGLCVPVLAAYSVPKCSASKVRTHLGKDDIFAGAHNFKGLFEGEDLDFGLVLELGFYMG